MGIDPVATPELPNLARASARLVRTQITETIREVADPVPPHLLSARVPIPAFSHPAEFCLLPAEVDDRCEVVAVVVVVFVVVIVVFVFVVVVVAFVFVVVVVVVVIVVVILEGLTTIAAARARLWSEVLNYRLRGGDPDTSKGRELGVGHLPSILVNERFSNKAKLYAGRNTPSVLP